MFLESHTAYFIFSAFVRQNRAWKMIKNRTMNLRKTKIFVLTLGMAMAAGSATYAQSTPAPAASSEISDSNIELFAKINKDMMPQQMAAQQKMMAALKEEGMDAQRFQTLAMAQQQGKLDDAEPTEEELKKLETISGKIRTIQQGLQEEVQAAVVAAGMKPMDFQKVAMAYQQDPKVRSKVDNIMKQQ